SNNVRVNLQNNTKEWGTLPASREWITKIMVKAIGKQAEALEADGEYTGFSDDAAISDGYSGYVKVAKQLGIITGSDNRFNPTSPITRAEIAVILGNAEKHVANRNARIVEGTLVSIADTIITLQTGSGLQT